MKRIFLSSALLVIAGTAAANPNIPLDVNVTNQSLSVTVDNPQTEVKINNDSANPVPVVVQGGVSGSSEPRFVGFSDDTVQGNTGLVGLHGACKNKFGSGARMCYSDEVFKTPDLESDPSVSKAWVQYSENFGLFYHNTRPNCRGWSDPEHGSHTINGHKMSMSSGISNCNEVLPVTCCK